MTHHVPEDGRSLMYEMRQGVSEKQFLKEMWTRRLLEHPPGKTKAGNGWPFVRIEHQSNVEPIRTAKKSPR